MDKLGPFLQDQAKSWIIPGFDEYNCTPTLNISSANGPSASEFLEHLETYQAILLAIATLLTILTLLLALTECLYVYYNVTLEQRRNKLYFLITLFPVSMIFCLIGMMMPRVSSLATSGGMLYFLLCLFVLVSLIRHLKNGRHELSKELLRAGKRINFESPPMCCFCKCLPTAKPTFENLRFLELIVLQAPILRACILFIEATITVEIQRDATYEVQVCEMATLISILLAVFGVHTIARLVSDLLSEYGFMWIFRIVDIALLCFSAQHPMVFQNILLRYNLLGCGPVLNPLENSRFICNFAVICELFLLSVLGAFTVTPSRGGMFDGRYKPRHTHVHTTDGDETESLTDTVISTSSATVNETSPSGGVLCLQTTNNDCPHSRHHETYTVVEEQPQQLEKSLLHAHSGNGYGSTQNLL